MTTATDTLRLAARYLQRYGWAQGTFYAQSCVEVFPPADAAGAIRAAVCGTPVDDLSTRTPEEIQDVQAAQQALIAHLDYLYGDYAFTADYVLGTWNDLPYQDAAGIISVLNAAAITRHHTVTPARAERVFALAGAA
jgi:hypothetical protein